MRPGAAPVLVSTVHSFALTEIIIPYARLAGLDVPDPILIAKQSIANSIFRDAYLRVTGRDPEKWFTIELDRLRRTIPNKDSNEWYSADQEKTSIIEEYERLLLASGLIDFDGLVLTGLKAIETCAWVRQGISAKYPVLVIDEYHDLGLPLHRMVCSLLDAGVRVIAVGDPDQSIYGFTGAKPSLLRELHSNEKVEGIELKLNYRCAGKIIEASKTLLANPPDSEPFDNRKGTIQIRELNKDIDGQARYALEQIVPGLLEDNPDWQLGDIAFLYRTFREGSSIAAIADELEIPFFRLDNGVVLKRTRLVEFLTDAAKWCAGGWQTGSVSLSHLIKSWRQLRPSLPTTADTLRARSWLIKSLFASRDPKMLLRSWLSNLYESTLEDALKNEPNLSDEVEIWEKLYGLTDTGQPWEKMVVENFSNQGRSEEQLNLITLHSSKGLEFNAVIMLGLEDGEFPSRYAREPEEIAEASRLFYVGVTRALESVNLLYDKHESPFIANIRESLE